LFGNVVDGKMALNDAGRMVEHIWFDLPNHCSNAELGQYVIMPNHFYEIIMLSNNGMNDVVPGFKPTHAGNQCTGSKHVGGGFQTRPYETWITGNHSGIQNIFISTYQRNAE